MVHTAKQGKRGAHLMKVFYFTATGNSLAVAKKIGGELISIPQIIDSDDLNFSGESIGVVFPIFNWREPKMVRHFLDKARFDTPYLFAVGTYGNLPGAAMSTIQSRAKKNGYEFHYTNHLLMVDNYLPLFDIDKEIKKMPKKDTDEKLKQIAHDIHSAKHSTIKTDPVIKAISAVVGSRMPPDAYAQKFTINEDCNLCGTCAQVCPTDNIEIVEKVGFHFRCEGCLACIHNCSKNAMHLPRQRSETRWRHPDVKTREIIKANSLPKS